MTAPPRNGAGDQCSQVLSTIKTMNSRAFGSSARRNTPTTATNIIVVMFRSARRRHSDFRFADTPTSGSLRSDFRFVDTPTSGSLRSDFRFADTPTSGSLRSDFRFANTPTSGSLRSDFRFVDTPTSGSPTLRLPVLRQQLSSPSLRLAHCADEQRVENDENSTRNDLDEDDVDDEDHWFRGRNDVVVRSLSSSTPCSRSSDDARS